MTNLKIGDMVHFKNDPSKLPYTITDPTPNGGYAKSERAKVSIWFSKNEVEVVK